MRTIFRSQHSLRIVSYYDILHVSPNASSAEIKSAYRRLARKLHPDSVSGSEDTALKFAAIAEAYEVLGNHKERAKYDQKLAETTGGGESIFDSSNPHIKRWRQMVYEKRYNDIIDRMIADERLEAMAFQKVVYPLTGFLIGTILTGALRPVLFSRSPSVVGQIAIGALFLASLILLARRLRDGFERYTAYDDNIHDSILDDDEPRFKGYSRYATGGILLFAILVCFGLGLVIGEALPQFSAALPDIFSRQISPEMLLYPPIVAFFVDIMHSIAARIEK